MARRDSCDLFWLSCSWQQLSRPRMQSRYTVWRKPSSQDSKINFSKHYRLAAWTTAIFRRPCATIPAILEPELQQRALETAPRNCRFARDTVRSGRRRAGRRRALRSSVFSARARRSAWYSAPPPSRHRGPDKQKLIKEQLAGRAIEAAQLGSSRAARLGWQSGFARLCPRHPGLPCNVRIGSKPVILEWRSVFRFAPESGPPICALMSTRPKWWKILNPSYSQKEGRSELFERRYAWRLRNRALVMAEHKPKWKEPRHRLWGTGWAPGTFQRREVTHSAVCPG